MTRMGNRSRMAPSVSVGACGRRAPLVQPEWEMTEGARIFVTQEAVNADVLSSKRRRRIQRRDLLCWQPPKSRSMGVMARKFFR